MSVLARRAEDIDEFMEQMEDSGAFYDILPKHQDMSEAGLYQANIEAGYAGGADADAAAAPATPAGETPPATAPPTNPTARPASPGGPQ